MSITQVVFSPTGGTQRVADIITSQWGDSCKKVDLTDINADYSAVSLGKEDIAVVAVPSYGGRVPGAAVDRLKVISGNEAKAIMICVYGNRAWEDTLTELQDVLESSGFVCVAAVAAVAEHSVFRQFAEGRPDKDDMAELTDFAVRIQKKLDLGDISTPKLEGNHGIYKEYKGIPFKPEGNSKCISCGLCSEKCPVGAIDPSDPRKTDKNKCISCMRCVRLCPQHARGFNGLVMKGAAVAMSAMLGGHKANHLFL